MTSYSISYKLQNITQLGNIRSFFGLDTSYKVLFRLLLDLELPCTPLFGSIYTVLYRNLDIRSLVAYTKTRGASIPLRGV